MRYLAIGNSLMVLVKVLWYSGEAVSFGVMGLNLLSFLSAMIVAPVALIVRRRTRVTGIPLPLPGRLAQLDEILDRMGVEEAFTISILVAQDGQVLLSWGYGLADQEQALAEV